MFPLMRQLINKPKFLQHNSFFSKTTVYISTSRREDAALFSFRDNRLQQCTKLLTRKSDLKKISRYLSTLQKQSASDSLSRLFVSINESRDFMALFPDIVLDLKETALKYDSPDAANWFSKVLEYNVPKGKLNRGILTIVTYKALVSKDLQTMENIKLAQYLGWCVELLQTFLIIADDIMDNSRTRRGHLCWHQIENVGLIAINDAIMIENGIYYILKKHFRHLDSYVDLIELFHEVCFITTCGQSLDLLNSITNIESFTMNKYKTIVANKTAYYTFYLPFGVAMHLAGIHDFDVFRQAKAILLEMGHFFQVQDDFLDCFGDPQITGKIGTDIEDNKCSWLAVSCMQRANEQQKAIMLECYGQNDPIKVERVKQLYGELDLPQIYVNYEGESYNRIKKHIEQISDVIPQQIFLQILNKIYQRNA